MDPLPQTANQPVVSPYLYASSSPTRYVDPSGMCPEFVADAGFIVFDIYSIVTGKRKDLAGNLTALGLDGLGLAIPCVTGLGAASRGAMAAGKAVAPAKRASDITVLGSYPDYVGLSDKLGARRFEIPKSVWDRMSGAQKWAANKKYLDRMIAKGDKVVLSNSGHKAKAGTTLYREIKYLESRGHRLSSDGYSMVPGN